jgi:hypothetical protein
MLKHENKMHKRSSCINNYSELINSCFLFVFRIKQTRYAFRASAIPLKVILTLKHINRHDTNLCLHVAPSHVVR